MKLARSLFGVNWRTNLSGWLTVFFAAVWAKPELVDFLPPTWRAWVVGCAQIFVFVSGAAFVSNAKDKQITGNGTPREPYQEKTKDGQNRVLPFLLAGLMLGLTGCASDGRGGASLQTPKVSTPIGKTNFTLWAYAVVGLSRNDTTETLETYAK